MCFRKLKLKRLYNKIKKELDEMPREEFIKKLKDFGFDVED